MPYYHCLIIQTLLLGLDMPAFPFNTLVNHVHFVCKITRCPGSWYLLLYLMFCWLLMSPLVPLMPQVLLQMPLPLWKYVWSLLYLCLPYGPYFLPWFLHAFWGLLCPRFDWLLAAWVLFTRGLLSPNLPPVIQCPVHCISAHLLFTLICPLWLKFELLEHYSVF